jgi:hypothetical protein
MCQSYYSPIVRLLRSRSFWMLGKRAFARKDKRYVCEWIYWVDLAEKELYNESVSRVECQYA